MKRTSVIFAAILMAFVFIKCKKSPDSPKLTYIVNGFTDVNVRQYADTTFFLPVTVEFQNGTQEPVSLTPSGMPSGITASPTTISGTPTYSTVIQFNVMDVAPGTYPVTITSSSASTSKKAYTFNVIVRSSPNCTDILEGLYKARDASSPYLDSSVYNSYVTTSTNANQLYIGLYDMHVNFDVNCSIGTLTMENANTAYYHFTNGSGTFTGSTMVLNYTITNVLTSVQHSFTTTLTKIR